jgi:adenosylcobyric acid synthase
VRIARAKGLRRDAARAHAPRCRSLPASARQALGGRMTLARCVMVLGTTSGAGKSLLTAALCRWYANAGLRVAPFKAQNMSNNARVVRGLHDAPGEIGAAQYFQALAAGVEPHVRMNPVLLKPEADTRSQVVVHGEIRRDLADLPWRERSQRLWPEAQSALQALRAEHEVVVIEGAGSPAEINLAASDFVNTRTAVAAEAACLLVTDIDRGGAFAHLYGTHALMDERVRGLLRGFVLNKFRGDEALLAPGPQQLQALTGVPTLAVLPMLRDHGLPEEDGWYARPQATAPGAKTIAVVAAPGISNLDEFEPLRRLPGWQLVWARSPQDAQQADWLVLPGSKHTRADLQWLRERGLDDAIVSHARAGRPLLAICGGLQWLGRTIADPQGSEGGTPGISDGLGLLPLHTELTARKTLRRRALRFGPLKGCWRPLSGLAVQGYEIHLGRTHALRDADAGDGAIAAATPGDAAAHAQCSPIAEPDSSEPLGWQRDNLLAVYLHGLFENPAVLQALFGVQPPSLADTFDRLARCLDERFAPGALMQLLQAHR